MVVGAGASSELRLPLGPELLSVVANALHFVFEFGVRQTDGDPDLYRALTSAFGSDVQRFARAGHRVFQVAPSFNSIDDALHYLSAEEEAVVVGKMGVAHAILQAERKSRVFGDGDRKKAVSEAHGSWLSELLAMALPGQAEAQVEKLFDNLVIINFNYDRTIEHYLLCALTERLGISEERARSTVEQLAIVRPYGSVGKLPWQQPSGIPFGGTGNEDLLAVSQNIETFTNGVQDSSVGDAARTALESAELVILLGFGFLQSNMRLLEAKNRGNASLFGTAYKIDSNNNLPLRGTLADLLKLKKTPELFNKKAADLLRDLRPILMQIIAS